MSVKLLIDRWNTYPRDISIGVQAGLRDAALEVEREAVGRAPFKTGNLRNSIGSVVDGTTAAVYSPVEYARVQEERFHYLEESLRAVAPSIPDRIQRHLP